MTQINLFDEIAVDGFCGGGGWSTGFELGLLRPVDVGINHDAAAIAMHMKNHPYIIELRSLYIPNDDHAYLLKLISSVSSESKVTSSDNGVTQSVEAKTGIALNSMVPIEPRVELCPFRTFIEVEQPASDFLLRISERGEIGLFAADGGVWKLEATRNIAAYFEEALKDLIEAGSVVVIR